MNAFIFASLFAGRVIKKGTGELPEWLKEQFAKLSTGNCRVGSNPTLSARFGVTKPKVLLIETHVRGVAQSG